MLYFNIFVPQPECASPDLGWMKFPLLILLPISNTLSTIIANFNGSVVPLILSLFGTPTLRVEAY